MGEQASTDDVLNFALRVWGYKQGEAVSFLIYIGDSLGLYRALRERGAVTAAELAQHTGLAERLVREWLLGNAAASLVESADGQRFELSAAGAEVLAEEDGSEWFAAGAFSAPFPPEVVEGILESFRTGIGLPYDAFGPLGAHTTARSLGPWVRHALVPRLLPQLDGVVAKLERGASVADVGCGAGVALEALARAFPKSRFVGFDPSHHAIADARDRVQRAGVTNVELEERSGDDLPTGGGFDLVLTFDCLHDMTRPLDTAKAIRGAIADDGTWLVKEIRSSGAFSSDRSNPMLALMYGMSVRVCLQSSLSEPGSPGYGTLGLPPNKVEDLARAAGFSKVTQHDIGEPPNLYYEITV